jgi:hypothetical protein
MKKMRKPKEMDPRYLKEAKPRVPRNVFLRPLDIPPMRTIKRP